MKKIVIAALLSTFVAAPAVASDFYLGAQVGSTSGGNGGGSKTGFGGLVGYTISPNISLEGAYNLLGNETVAGTSVKTTASGASGVYTYPASERISVLGKVGFASVTTAAGSFSSSSNGLSLGLAGQYNANAAVGVRFGFEHYTVTGGSLNTMYMGGVFKF